jgi:hypothetical protein
MEEEAHTRVWAHSMVEGALGGGEAHSLRKGALHFNEIFL